MPTPALTRSPRGAWRSTPGWLPSLLVVGLAAIAAAAVGNAQQPVPPTPVQQQPAHQNPQQDPAPASPRGARAGRRAGGPQGRGRRRDERPLQLPEFTPVAAPDRDGLAGKQHFWFTMYPNFVAKFDPATDTLVQKIALAGGLFFSTRLSHDRTRLMVVTDQQHSIEVVDLAAGELVARHTFQEDGMILRVRSVIECPGGRHWLVQTDRVKKEIDRYSFEPSEYLLYDSLEQKIVRKLPKLPEALSRRATLSADGTRWLAQQDGDLLFLDARTFEEQGRIVLSEPRYFGAGPLRLSGTDLYDGRDPRRARMLFTTTDPVEKRRTNWGVVELDLAEQRVLEVTEWGPSKTSWGMRIAYGPRIAATMDRGGRDGERRLVTYDLNTGQQLAEAYHEFRPRRSLVAIAPDASKLYVGVAGSDFEVFDGKTLARLKTVELEGEIVGTIHTIDG